jgi:hypothetical protein
VTGFAVEPAFFTVPSQLVLDDAARRAFAADPQACLALASLTQARGWRASQRVTVPEIVTGHLAEDPIHCTLVGVVGTADGRDYGQIFLRGELLRDRSSATRPDRADAVVVAVPGRHGQTAATELGRALPGLDVFVDHDRTWGRQVPVTGGSSAPPDVAPQ